MHKKRYGLIHNVCIYIYTPTLYIYILYTYCIYILYIYCVYILYICVCTYFFPWQLSKYNKTSLNRPTLNGPFREVVGYGVKISICMNIWDPNNTINIGRWSICGGGRLERLERFYCMPCQLTHRVVLIMKLVSFGIYSLLCMSSINIYFHKLNMVNIY